MRELAAIGLVALLFGLGAYYTAADVGLFAAANLVGGTLALAAASVLGLRRVRAGGAPAARRILFARLMTVALALLASVAGVVALDRAGPTWDWTREDRYSLSPALRESLAALPAPLSATLYTDTFDNRARSTRLLLETLASAGPVTVRQRLLDEASEEAERFEIGASNAVVLEMDGRFETVERPTEGALYEALQRLVQPRRAILYVARGEGEGGLEDSGQAGYSGLAAALATEGYQLRDLVLAGAAEIPDDAAALLVVGARRPLRDTALAALEDWLARGGRLVALLEPGAETGLEALLERWGFGLPDAVVVDPASGPVEGAPPGVNPVVFQYGEHPATRGLGPTRMTFFLVARPVEVVRKPEPDDDLRAIAFSSRRAWLARDVGGVLRGIAPERPADAIEDYWPIAAAGRYPRAAGEARIAVFGDSDFASNHYLRALFNLDLLMNAVHWTAAREPAITLRPKSLTPDQFPMTPQQSLQLLYSVGLLVPELCLVAAALTWVRRRSA